MNEREAAAHDAAVAAQEGAWVRPVLPNHRQGARILIRLGHDAPHTSYRVFTEYDPHELAAILWHQEPRFYTFEFNQTDQRWDITLNADEVVAYLEEKKYETP